MSCHPERSRWESEANPPAESRDPYPLIRIRSVQLNLGASFKPDFGLSVKFALIRSKMIGERPRVFHAAFGSDLRSGHSGALVLPFALGDFRGCTERR